MIRDDDKRCYLKAKRDGIDYAFGKDDKSSIMYPLREQGGLVFPYNPNVQMMYSANFSSIDFTHANYPLKGYTNSSTGQINVIADFAVQTKKDAEYLLAVMTFCKTITKTNFGQSSEYAGTPPPTLLFNYLGKYNMKDVPVLVIDASYTFETDVDYVEVPEKDTYVPSFMTVTLSMDVNQNPLNVRKEFDLEKFRKGELITKGYL